MIPITKPFMPPQELYQAYVNNIWRREDLTNNGPLVQELETKLQQYLKTRHFCLTSNGTTALQIAIKVLELEGEVITTPFSFVATTSSIIWEGCTPVFVDIDPETLNIDPFQIEAAITKNTSAIVATHIFGNPCNIEAIECIARQHNLKVIYDAAHCFGTQYKGESVFNFGDISITSFHATKLYHSIEGGAIVSHDPEIHFRVQRMRNFGYNGPDNFEGVGINGKNSEFHAAMGLCNLHYMDELLEQRRIQWLRYAKFLECADVRGIKINSAANFNYSYFPVIFESEEQLMQVKKSLEDHNIFTRRYFYPSLNELDYVNYFDVPVSSDISRRILCLPLYHELVESQQQYITSIINIYLDENYEKDFDAWGQPFSGTSY